MNAEESVSAFYDSERERLLRVYATYGLSRLTTEDQRYLDGIEAAEGVLVRRRAIREKVWQALSESVQPKIESD